MDTQSTPALLENETSTEALQEAIKAMAALIATMQKREQSLHALTSQQLQVLNGAAATPTGMSIGWSTTRCRG